MAYCELCNHVKGGCTGACRVKSGIPSFPLIHLAKMSKKTKKSKGKKREHDKAGRIFIDGGSGVVTSSPTMSTTYMDTGSISILNSKTKKKEEYVPCAYTHKPMPLGEGLVVYGGKASSPVKKDCDIYVSLDYGTHEDPKAYPWNPGEFIYFHITDMSAPKSASEFKKMIDWLAAQIKAGKSVHIGCIGGHGRTGTVLAALAKVMTGNEDAITYVRENYCKKAVESSSQVNFLHEHFGIKKVKGSKEYDSAKWESNHARWMRGEYDNVPLEKRGKTHTEKFNERYGLGDLLSEIIPINGDNVWGIT